MGNVQSITRYGLHDDNQYELIDNVSLYYNGNQVVHADDAVNDGPNYAGAFHFRDSNGTQWDTEYEYDKNGCLTRDRNKGILQIQYNLLNLPSKTTFSDQGYINYQYSASGKKQMVWGSAPGQGSKSQFYLGNYVYGNGVKQLLVDGGYVTFSGTTPQYHFYVKDHLGNNRMVVNANGTVEQVNHYYAFGGLMGENTGSDLQDFKYNGKELDRLHGLDWYDYNARHMDAVRGVFTTMDPLAEKYFDISPYAYCGSNPIRFSDKTGCDRLDIVSGWFIGIATNIIPGTSGLRDSYTPNNDTDYNNALQGADNAMTVIGEGMSDAGKGGIAVGTAIAATGEAVVVCSGGSAALAGGTAVVAGVTLTSASAVVGAVGSTVKMNATSNKSGGYNKGNNNKKPESTNVNSQNTGSSKNHSNSGYNSTEAEHKKNARGSTKGMHEKGQARKARDKGHEKGDVRRKRYK